MKRHMTKAGSFCSLVLVIFILGSSKLSGQDIHFSQFWMSPLLVNPALAGADYDLQAVANYRNQWSSVASPYKTFNASFDMKLNKTKAKKGFFAAGVNFFSDKAGDSKMGTTSGAISMAYHIVLNKNSNLGAGITGGFVQRTIDYTQLQWMSQYAGGSYNSALPSGEPVGNERSHFISSGGGVVWNYKTSEGYISGNDQVKTTAGISIFQVHQPSYSFYKSDEKLHTKIVAHATGLFGIKNSNLCIVPGFIISMQGSAKELLLGSSFKYIVKESSKYTGNVKGAALSLGLYYRNRDALIPTFLLEMGQYALGLSYDVNISGLKNASTGRGGFEISLRFINPNPFLYKSSSRI